METEQTVKVVDQLVEEQVEDSEEQYDCTTTPAAEWLTLNSGNILLRVNETFLGVLLRVTETSYIVSYNNAVRGPFDLEAAKAALSQAVVAGCQKQISRYRMIEAAMSGDDSTLVITTFWAAVKVKDPTVVAAVEQAPTEKPVSQPEPSTP